MTTEHTKTAEGWVMVPVEPTEEMVKAGNKITWPLPCRQPYRAMLAAAPKASPADPAQQATKGEADRWNDCFSPSQRETNPTIADLASRYLWLRDFSGADIRSLLGVGDLTSLDAFIDRRLASTALAAQQAPVERELNLARVESFALEASVGHLCALVDEVRGLLSRAIGAMSAVHAAASPDESTPDLDARIPAASFRAFVDEHAALMYEAKNGAAATSLTQPAVAEPAQLLARAKDLHEKAGMHWSDAEELALNEVGIDCDAIDELIGECGYAGLQSLLIDEDELRQFTRAVLVHQPAASAQPPAKVEREGLTDPQIHDLADAFKSQYQHGGTTFDFDYMGFARAIEAAHGIPAPTVGEKGEGKPCES